MNNRGQALVEFILIVPVLLMILLAIVDFSNIFTTKYNLQNDLDLIVELYKDNKQDDYYNYANNNNIKLNIKDDNNLTTIKISKKIEITTPILNQVLKSPYEISESITIYEQ